MSYDIRQGDALGSSTTAPLNHAGLERTIQEQTICADYLKGYGQDKSGAKMGLADWVMEEALIREEVAYQEFLEGKRIAQRCFDIRDCG